MPGRYDAIIIGSGQAGPFLAVRLAEAGLKTLLIERGHLGGTCVNTGCMPTKTLVASARVAHLARRAESYGVRVGGPVDVDLAAVRARKAEIVETSRANLEAWLGAIPNLTRLRAHAHFLAPNTVAAGGETYRAPRIFINVGGRPAVPQWPGLMQTPHLTSTEALEVAELPAHLVIAGASYIGLEFAQIFRRFGAAVTVIDSAARIVAREDPDVSLALRRILECEGIAFELGVRDIEVAPRSCGFELTAAGAAGSVLLTGSHLLLAVGRRPNSDGLDLDRAGVATDARGYIVVDDELRTNVPGIWALGDVNGRGAFTHTSYNDFEIVAANLLDGARRSVRDRIPAYALFTDPPLARVGLTEAEALETCKDVLIGHLPMRRVGRARERGETQGFMKALVDGATGKLLGAALLGIEADEAIHGLILAMASGLRVDDLRRAVPIHPTVSELIPTLLSGLEALSPRRSERTACPKKEMEQA
jgi:pyruvate/2-oxoglutarate dehydrogenase complex dihydrolipoamide dehydrogenase (E3) component